MAALDAAIHAMTSPIPWATEHPQRNGMDRPAKPGDDGEQVLVDDGSCPKGEIKQLTGGSDLSSNHHGNVHRLKRCIPWP